MTAAEPAPRDLNTGSDAAVMDREHLSTMTGGDTELALEVIEIFRHQAEIWTRMLDPKSQARHWADAAHSIKGAALSVGANKLAGSCGAAETLGRREDPPSVAEAAVALSQVKDDLGEALEAAAHLAHKIERTGAV